MADSKKVAAPQTDYAKEELPSLLEEIVAATKIQKTDEGYAVARQGVPALLTNLLTSEFATERIDNNAIDQVIAAIDQNISKVLDEVLHHKEFQAVASTWLGIKFLVDRTDFRANNRIKILDVSQQDLLADFEDSAEITKSGLYRHAYTDEYGTLGGKPYTAILANYEFGRGPQDMLLLQKASAVATMAHAPFIASVGAQFFGLNDIQELPSLKDLESLFEGPQYAKWRALREAEDSGSLGLVLPRFLLRLPFGSNTVPTKSFNYEETVDSHNDYLWGNAVFAFGSLLTQSFSKYGWCVNIIGPQAGGTVHDLPLHVYEAMGADTIKTPTEVILSERRDNELADQGFIPLVFRKDSDNACFFSANTVLKPKKFGNTDEAKAAETNYKLNTQLPYRFIACQFARTMKVKTREDLGQFKEASDVQRELNTWIRGYVADQEAASPEVRARRPLRQASVTVTETPGEPGVYRHAIKLRPHFKYMGANIELSLVGRLDVG